MPAKKTEETKKKKTNKEKLMDKLDKLDNDYLVFKNFVAITFFLLAFFVLTPLYRQGDFSNWLLVILGFIVIALNKVLIIEFIIKTLRLQTDPDVKRYSAVVSLNSIFGLALPIFYINVVLARIVNVFFFQMQDTGTIFCEFRRWLSYFLYREVGLYEKLDSLAFSLIFAAFILFLFGGAFEKMHRKK